MVKFTIDEIRESCVAAPLATPRDGPSLDLPPDLS